MRRGINYPRADVKLRAENLTGDIEKWLYPDPEEIESYPTMRFDFIQDTYTLSSCLIWKR